MIGEQQFPFLAEKGHVVSLVGGGGKTTLLYAMASHCAQKGWRVLVSTTTHILRPENGSLSGDKLGICRNTGTLGPRLLCRGGLSGSQR